MAQGNASSAPGTKSAGTSPDIFNAAAGGMNAGGMATGVAGQGFTDMADPSATIASGMPTYMNPFIDDVVNRTGADIDRQTRMGIGAVGDSAVGQGAFGGARHGLAEAEVASEGTRAMGDVAARLRQAGFDTAGRFAGQDIDNRSRALTNLGAIGGQAFGQGRDALATGQGMNDRQAAEGEAIRQLQQRLMEDAQGMFGGYAGQPMNSTASLLELLAGNPLSTTSNTTQTKNPGTKTMLGNALGIGRAVGAGGM